ncbi:Peroxisomal membrane signal receptor PTS1 [Pichia californica]|uniref:Peroxisomal targeting signal receptor n=1 Tax=Pichia californica TaxID=460514 RepID=A0A9P6WNA0_9ASCO|nr:Peroxisomal membrane signal receptor PTS1 [[Candida] californica]KAG0690115.1 Peroxisomal membrane signal receptor PTS1 [[Candida] californica]
MSFLTGGSECAATNNPLSQLSKRSEFDTSVQNSIRNGSLNNTHLPNSLISNSNINQNDKIMMNSFMDQNNHQINNNNNNHNNSFNFQPISHELNNIQHLQNFNQNFNQLQNIQPLQNSTSWSAEFKNSDNLLSGPLLQQQQNQQNQLTGMNNINLPMNRNLMMMNSSMNMLQPSYRLNNMQSTSINNQQQQQQQQQIPTQQQQQQQSSNEKLDWEDSFKEIEQQVIDTNNDNIQLNELPLNPLDTMSMPIGFNEKYHDSYQFEEKNEFLNNPNAYEIGCKLMEGGAKLSEAALAFEAALQEDSNHINAWLKLGQVQIQNEKELQGITALENCLLIDTKNLTALMNLAISYVNEGYDNAAFKTFETWIETKYPDIVSKARIENPTDISDDRYSLNKRITNLFLKAAQLSPTGVNIDSEIQTGLGVLFYSMEEYDKTLDCFQAAIRCNPNDALSWNRLGASYANSNRPEQAIEAYSKALQLNPNFVRARYNLGVSFINMGMYKDAVDHLLIGLSMHEVESPDGNGMLVSDTEQSSNLIETLKRAFLAMDRRDLIDMVRPGMNVEHFRHENNL